MFEQSKADEMNEKLADFVIARATSLNPATATPDEVLSLARLATVVNEAPKAITILDEHAQRSLNIK